MRKSPAIAFVMEIMKLVNARETALEHFHITQRGDCPQLARRDAIDKMIHDVAPCPETVPIGPSMLGERRHSALERMAVEVRNAR
jgi:hypothetical protein